eukprot:scaffold180117_cov37-Tisochrysis_lutea.AAC.1
MCTAFSSSNAACIPSVLSSRTSVNSSQGQQGVVVHTLCEKRHSRGPDVWTKVAPLASCLDASDSESIEVPLTLLAHSSWPADPTLVLHALAVLEACTTQPCVFVFRSRTN